MSVMRLRTAALASVGVMLLLIPARASVPAGRWGNGSTDQPVTGATDQRGNDAKKAEPGWEPLFDGKSLADWQPTKFFGEGPVKVENSQIVLEAGSDLTG